MAASEGAARAAPGSCAARLRRAFKDRGANRLLSPTASRPPSWPMTQHPDRSQRQMLRAANALSLAIAIAITGAVACSCPVKPALTSRSPIASLLAGLSLSAQLIFGWVCWRPSRLAVRSWQAHSGHGPRRPAVRCELGQAGMTPTRLARRTAADTDEHIRSAGRPRAAAMIVCASSTPPAPRVVDEWSAVAGKVAHDVGVLLRGQNAGQARSLSLRSEIDRTARA